MEKGVPVEVGEDFHNGIIVHAPGVDTCELVKATWTVSSTKVEGEHGSIAYVQRQAGSRGADGFSQHAIATYNKEQNKLVIQRLSAEQMVQVSVATQRAHKRGRKESSGSDPLAIFGSKKKLRAGERIRSRRAGLAAEQVRVSPEQLNVGSDTKGKSAKTESEQEDDAAPPRDLEATEPEEAYPGYRLAPKEQRDALPKGDIVAALKSEEGSMDALKEKGAPESITALLEGGRMSGEVEDKPGHLAHLRALISAANWPKRLGKGTADAKRKELPPQVAEPFMATFYESGDDDGPLSRPRAKDDLLLGTVVMQFLRLAGWKAQTHELSRDLRVTPKRIADVARQLGCKAKRVSKAESGSAANYTLSLDLKPEKPLKHALPGAPRRGPRSSS